MKNLPILRQSFQVGLSWEELLGFTAAQLATPILGGCYTPVEQLPSTSNPLQEPPQPRKARQAWASSTKAASIGGGLANPSCPGEEPLGLSVAQIAAPTLGGYCTPVEQLTSTASPLEEPHSPVTPEQALPSRVKSATIVVWTSQSCLPSGSPPLLHTLLAPSTLQKSHTASKKD